MTWWTFSLLSAFFAALTAIFGKIGVADVDSNLATAIRTVVIVLFSWGIVLARGGADKLRSIGGRTWLFLVLSGLCTGLSWLAYYRALQLGPASKVAPVDKLSVVLTVILAAVFLGEPVDARLVGGVGLIVAGAIVLIR